MIKYFYRNFSKLNNNLQEVTKTVYYSKTIKLATTINFYHKNKMISIEKANELISKNINITERRHAAILFDLSQKNLMYSYLSSKENLKTEEDKLITNYKINDQQ